MHNIIQLFCSDLMLLKMIGSGLLAFQYGAFLNF